MKTVKYQNFKITSSENKYDKLAPWENNYSNYNHHVITVINTETKKRTSFDFWASIRNPELETEYDILNAFYCFVSDAVAGIGTFDDFVSEFGYEINSLNGYRNARDTWKACKRALEKFKRVSGYDESEIYDFINYLSEIAS